MNARGAKVLLDHMHCNWTLPVGNGGYSVRIGANKARSSMAGGRAGFALLYLLSRMFVIRRGLPDGLGWEVRASTHSAEL